MKVKLRVVDKEKCHVRLEFINNTQATEYLDNSRLYNGGDSIANQFHFEPREAVRYVGPIVKRTPLGEDDVVTLGAAERLFTEVIDLKKLYQIKGTKKLKVRYSGSHPLDGLHNGACTIESGWETLDNSWDADYQFVLATHGAKFGFI